LVKLLLERVFQFSAFIGDFSVFLQKLTEILEVELPVEPPLLEKEVDSPAHEIVLTGIVFRRHQLIAGIIDELMRLFDLEVIGESLDEGNEERLINVWLRFGSDEPVECEAVVPAEL
jgi:hypothetical protein